MHRHGDVRSAEEREVTELLRRDVETGELVVVREEAALLLRVAHHLGVAQDVHQHHPTEVLARVADVLLFLLLGLDYVDTGFRQHRHRVLDLLGGHFVGGQGGIQFIVSDIAPLLAFLDELLELGAEGIEQGGIGTLVAGFRGLGLGYGRGLGRHWVPMECDNTIPAASWPSGWLQEGCRGRAAR